MKYNQPLDQPNTPDAPYVDGSPGAGIQGSIVPAASVELDQREVVEVISRANSRGYKDFSDTLCAPAANTDLMQLRKAIEGFIRSLPPPIFPSDLIDSHVTFKVHGPTGDFPDLNAAFEYLSKFKITHNGFVTLQLAGATAGMAQVFNYSTMVFFDHPSNHRIGIVGAPMLASVPTTAASYAMTGNTAPQRAADTVTNLNMLRTKFATELHFTLGCGIEIDNVGLGYLDGILITGDHSTGPISDQQLLAACGTNDAPSPLLQAFLPPQGISGGLACVNGNYGFTVIGGGQTSSYGSNGPLVSIGHNQMGFVANSRSALFASSIISLSNGDVGIFSNVNSAVTTNGGTSACNANIGIFVAGNSYYVQNGGVIYKNNSYGLYVIEQASATCVADYGGGGANANGSFGAYAANNSMARLGGSINITSSPPANVQGNNAAWVFVP
jgi:hypothetical protein